MGRVPAPAVPSPTTFGEHVVSTPLPEHARRQAAPRPRLGDPPQATLIVPPLVSGQLIREWQFSELRGDALTEVVVGQGIQVNGLVDELNDFGLTPHDSFVFSPKTGSQPPDGIATGQIVATADGVTYYVGTEAPAGNADVPTDPIGSRAQLRQTQSFIKRAADATFSFTVSQAFVETTDRNAVLGRVCPPEHSDGLLCDLIKGELFLDVQAFTVPPAPDITPFDTFFHVGGGITVVGYADNWNSDAWTTHFSQLPLWSIGDFNFQIEPLGSSSEGHVLMILNNFRTFTVDLSSIDIGQVFTVQAFALATAYDRISGPPSEFGSSVSAFLRDPQGADGTSIEFTGLVPIDVLGLDAPPDAPVDPLPCPPDATGEPGTLQLSANSYTVGESSLTPPVRITRTGGTSGPVTATITTTDGSAVAGVDYLPVHSSVSFADGDDAPRAVAIPILPNDVGGQGDRTVVITLSDPGGCATLGSPATAVLKIRDDDPGPPPQQPYGLDPTFGVGGKATPTPRFGGSRSSMAVQPDGKIVMAGGTFSAFALARFTADGKLDDSFGTGGTVTTLVNGQAVQQEALGVAVQPDGAIVAAGYTVADGVVVVRYLSDGQPDDTFGTHGVVSGIMPGRLDDVVLQEDGRIVVAGIATREDDEHEQDFGDVVVVRLLPDGQLDPSFGLGQPVTTDVGAVTNEAQNVVVQPNGSIVVSGASPNPGSDGVGIDDHTDVARYGPDGLLDPTFGTGGRLTLDASVGADLVVQTDGRLLLIGTADATPSGGAPGTVTDVSVVRLNRDGTPDPSFGGGTVNISVSALTSVTGEPNRDTGSGLTLQPDGRILLAGTAGSLNSNFAVARLLADGSLDTEFTDTGVLVIDFSQFNDTGENVAVTSDSKIVVSGAARQISGSGYGVARLAPQDGG
jgi:uncharacterized delta-60 repeat protein